jgi:uncharacterized protein (UPF0332 family)
MSFQWRDYLIFAEDTTSGTPSKVPEAYFRSSISRAYYSVYWVSRNHAVKKGLTITKESSHEVVREYYLTSNDNDYKEIGEDLKRLWKERKDADYNGSLNISQMQAQLAVAGAKLTMRKLDQIAAK